MAGVTGGQLMFGHDVGLLFATIQPSVCFNMQQT